MGDCMNELIGNTPLIEIFYRFRGQEKSFFAKLEYYNFTGSIKDRVVWYILKKAKEEGILKDGVPLVEATSGNTGISLSALGAHFSHPVQIYMPDWVSRERVSLMESYGANVVLVSKEEGGFLKCIERARKYAEEHQGFLLNQFSNVWNKEAHIQTTAKEIEKVLGSIDGFISGIGTGGTLMGVGEYFKKKYGSKIIALEPENMSLLKLHTKGSHKIEGIGDDFIPDLVNPKQIDQIVTISDEEALAMSRKLARELGLGVGISSGANALATILENQDHQKLVTVFPDDQKKYLSGDYTKRGKEQTIVSDITFLTFKVHLPK